MAASQWDALHELEELLQRYGHGARLAGAAPARSEHLATADWKPPVDIAESAEAYLIEMDIPGVPRDGVRVTIEDGVLTIQGSREAADEAGTARRAHRSERPHGRFARSFALPEGADPERVSARIEDGVLHVAIARRAERGRRGVEIRVD
ncbi:MAG: hypothetical protein CALGDGBN_03008 [Pseudomonadales bacterium]|nr:hypothetical protein [Pseudomonadales bacterium]